MALQSRNTLYCPVNMACEILQPRWTIHIIAEMLWGSNRFNELRRAIPNISPTLLSKRLKELECRGLVVRIEGRAAGNVTYFPTKAAANLEPIINALGHWAYTNVGVRDHVGNADVRAFVWSLRRNIAVDVLPKRRVVIRLLFPEQAEGLKKFWITAKPDAPVDVCFLDPGYDVDLYITTSLSDLVAVKFGHSKLQHKIDTGRIDLTGTTQIARTIGQWLVLSSFVPSAP